MLIRITAPHFVAGIDTETRQYAPIIWYMKAWSVDEVRSYCEKKGWKFEMVKEE